MERPPVFRHTPLRRRVLTAAITSVVLAFFGVPLASIRYGGAAGAIGGMMILGVLMVLQLPAFLLLKRLGALPTVE